MTCYNSDGLAQGATHNRKQQHLFRLGSTLLHSRLAFAFSYAGQHRLDDTAVITGTLVNNGAASPSVTSLLWVSFCHVHDPICRHIISWLQPGMYSWQHNNPLSVNSTMKSI